MSTTEVVVPSDFFDGATEVVVSNWLYGNGEAVNSGAVIAELMAEKAVFELEANATGVLHILIEEETPLQAGQVVATIGGR